MKWISVKDRLPKFKAIIINNMNALDAKGQMSHIWIGNIHWSEEYNQYITFDDSWCKVYGITHWMPLPKPLKE